MNGCQRKGRDNEIMGITVDTFRQSLFEGIHGVTRNCKSGGSCVKNETLLRVYSHTSNFVHALNYK